MQGATIAKTPFLVTGLPRSRTAWLASALTTEVSDCHHEPVGHFPSYELFRDWLASSHPYQIGASDHAIGFIAGRLIRDLQPRILIVERPFSDALESFERYMDGIPIDIVAVIDFMTRLRTCLDALSGPLVRRIKFDDLDRVGPLSAALRWLVPAIDLTGLATAMTVNVQVDRSAMLRRGQPHQWYLQ